MQILDEWMKDIPQQFLGKHNIEVFIKAFAKQLQELQQVFDDMKTKLDIDTASGQNLDYVGTIIPLSRKEAGELAGLNVIEPVISDERYRRYLRYKNLMNTNECTYYDLMEGLSLLWENHPHIRYAERLEYPATIFLDMPSFSLDIEDPAKERTLAIKPAGVGLIYAISYEGFFDNSNLEEIKLRNIEFKLAISFWGCYVFNGDWTLNGMVMLCQKRHYSLVLGLKYSCAIFTGKEKIRQAFLGIKMAFNINTGAYAAFVTRFRINQILDIFIKAHLSMCMRLYTDTEEIGETTVIVKTKDYWFFDGSVNMDGTKLFNSVYRKEVIE